MLADDVSVYGSRGDVKYQDKPVEAIRAEHRRQKELLNMLVLVFDIAVDFNEQPAVNCQISAVLAGPFAPDRWEVAHLVAIMAHNRSWNHGVEGPTDDQEVKALRRRQVRNFLTTLLLSQGTPGDCGEC